MKNKVLKVSLTIVFILGLLLGIKTYVFADAVYVPPPGEINKTDYNEYYNYLSNESYNGYANTDYPVYTNNSISNPEDNEVSRRDEDDDDDDDDEDDEEKLYMKIAMGVIGGLVLLNLLFSIIILAKTGKKSNE